MDENKTYTITLADGSVLTDLTLSGDDYISKTLLTEDTFTGKLSTVTISASDGTSEILTNASLNFFAHYADGWYFQLIQPSEEEIRQEKIRADIDYIALMSDIELEA